MIRASLRALVPVLALALPTAAAAESFRFVALGDMPYGKPKKVYPPFRTLIKTINATGPDLVLHVGDTKSGSTPCSDKMLDEQLAFMNSFEAPTLYTPGDNEWTDCYRKKAGKFDPIERLAYLRNTYFAEPGKSFGAEQIDLAHQGDAGYPENVRVMHKGIMFVTAHVVGSNNNLEARNMSAVEEFFARDEADRDWLKESFEIAESEEAAGLVLGIHADMFEFDWNEFGNESWLRHSGFRGFGRDLQDLAAQFDKPVLLIFGDSHKFRVFRPFKSKAPNVTALEVFGAKRMHAVEVLVSRQGDDASFAIAPLLNPALN